MIRSIGAALALVFLLLALAENADAADQLWRNNGVTVILHERACKDEDIAMYLLTMRSVKESKAASVDFRGQKLQACWGLQPDGEAVLIDEDGDGGTLTKEGFKPNASI